MTNEVADKIVRGITDKIECNTVDIDDWAEFWGFTREEYEEFLDMAIKALEQTRWIPCSEKMPDINIHVLAQFVMGGMAECYYAHNWWHIVGGFRISGDEVIAWMPLPEAYKEENNGE